ncbi:DUF3180 domain-containing protein [Streptosporangium sp. KLBMP 9127]|nr:DUF3180 domain-containing protein [Streptosporangium sp. KLBMP 9127]
MRPTRPMALVAIIVALAAITWLILQRMYGTLPTVPWSAIPSMLLLAIGEAYSGWMTRARLEGRHETKPVEPMVVARLAALAKASAYAGAVFGGVFAGFVLHVIELLGQDTPRRDFFVAGGSFLSCVVLICAALYLEYCCRIPKDDEEADTRP